MKNRIRMACLLTSLISLAAYGQNPWKDKWREMNYVNVNGVEIAYDDVGSGEAILLIHGINVADAFVRMLDEPALRDYRLINMHLRGNGQSSDYEEPSGGWESAADALALLEELEIERAHVVGHSQGGQMALYVAMTGSDAVQSLILVESNLPLIDGVETGSDEASLLRWWQTWYSNEGDPTERAAVWQNFMLGYDRETELAPFYPHALEHVARAFSVDAELFKTSPVTESDFEKIQAPVLWVWSEDPSDGIERSHAILVEQIPAMEHATAGADHLLQVFDPGALAEVIAGFAGRYPVQ